MKGVINKFLRNGSGPFPFKGFRWWALSALVLLCLLLFWRCLPSPLFNDPFSRVLLDREGKLLCASLAADEQWRFPPVTLVPEKFEKAIISYEDGRFFYHPGIDPLAILRAIRLNLTAGHVVSGASTISMQVIRLSRQGKPRTLKEKLIEMILALRLELSMSKKEILALFASHAPFGGNVVGIDAASWRYFGCDPDQLSWAECAMLAVLPNSPSLIHPGKNRETLKLKRDALLDKLEEKGVLDSMTCSLAKEEPLPPRPLSIPNLAPHLASRIGNRQNTPSDDQFRFRTTLDKSIQTRSVEIINRHHESLSANGIHNAAALIIEVETGNVIAYVGNIHNMEDKEHGNYVDIISAPRSTGSILKPLLYAAMLEDGEILPSELVADIPTQIGGFAPQNYSRTYQGAVPAYMALARSLNVPAVRMLRSYGIDRFYLHLKRLGMTTLHRPAKDYGLSLILGGAEGTLFDITSMYAGMARRVNGFFEGDNSKDKAAFEINVLSGNEGKVAAGNIHETRDVPEESFNLPVSAGSCWLTLNAMLEVVRPGDEAGWRNFASSKKIAWKTGTSYGFRDGWAAGVTPKYAVGVWAGNADGEGRPALTGISTAAPILFELFGILDDSEWFPCPENDLIEVDVCVKSGYRAGPQCVGTKKELIPLAGLQSEACPYCKVVHCDSDHSWRVNSECERVAEIEKVNWFVLPPAMEWFYKLKHSDYHVLPPFRDDCIESMAASGPESMTIIYPGQSGQIYVPIELTGLRGKTVFEAAHRDPLATIFWHLDEEYLDATSGIHQMALSPEPGKHRLTLVDEKGELISREFTVLSKD